MASLGLDLTDELTPALRGMGDALARPDVRAVMGRAVVGVLRGHFEKLEAERHQNLAGTHFYGQASRSVQQPQVGSDGFSIAINQVGVAQRYFGGTIVAGANGSGAKFLTIPAIPQALGRRAGEFTNLKFVFFKKLDLGALVATEGDRVSFKGAPRAQKDQGRRIVPREDGRPQVVFWLKRSVTQAADPSVLPEPEEMAAAAYGAAESYLNRVFARQAEGGGSTLP